MSPKKKGDGNRNKKDKKEKKKQKKKKERKQKDDFAGMTEEERAQVIRDRRAHKNQKLNLWIEERLPPLIAQWKAQEKGTWQGKYESQRQMSKRTGIPRSTLG